MGSGIEISRVGRLSQSVLLLIYTLVTVNIGWTLPRAFAYILAVGAGIILMLSVYIINGGLTFFFINGIEISILFNGSGSDTLHYPADVIPGRLKYIFFTVFPFAAVNYYPFRYILGRTDEIRYIFIPFISLIILFLAVKFFSFSAENYSSSGS